MDAENLISLKEAAEELGVKKSRLNYYAWLELITPVKELNRFLIFDKEVLFRQVAEINEMQNRGLSLKEIAKLKRDKK